MGGLDFFEIARKRTAMKIPITALCMQASVSTRAYRHIQAGTREPLPGTLAKLNAALSRFNKAFKGDPGPMAVHAAYRLALVVAAAELGADVRGALTSDPARKATADLEWRSAAHVRRLAFWICNGLCGFKQSDIGRAAGVNKQAVNDAIRKLEDDEHPEIRKIRRKLEELFA